MNSVSSTQLLVLGETEFVTLLRESLWTVSSYALPLYAGLAFVTTLPRDEVLALMRSRVAQVDAAMASLRFVQTHDLDEGHAELLALKAALGEAEANWARVFIGRIEAGAYRFAGEARPANAQAAHETG